MPCSRHNSRHFREDKDGHFLCEGNIGKTKTQRTSVIDKRENILRYTFKKYIKGSRRNFYTFGDDVNNI